MGTKKESVEGIKSKVARQLGRQLERVDVDGILRSVGLQLFKKQKGMTLPILASFGAGVAIGASAGLLLARTSGKELRAQIGALVGRLVRSRADDDLQSTEEVDVSGVPAARPKGANGRSKRQMPESVTT